MTLNTDVHLLCGHICAMLDLVVLTSQTDHVHAVELGMEDTWTFGKAQYVSKEKINRK